MTKRSIEVPRGYTRDFEKIENKGWEKSIAHPKATILPVVQQFYANVKEGEWDNVFMQGKRLRFSHTIINEFFRLNDLETLEYNSIMGKEFDAQQILEILVAPRAQCVTLIAMTQTNENQCLVICNQSQ